MLYQLPHADSYRGIIQFIIERSRHVNIYAHYRHMRFAFDSILYSNLLL